MIVAIICIALVAALVGSIVYGQRLIKTEKSDLVFGNPSRAMGGWHWMVAGLSSVMLLWYWFSWDAARSYFPKAGNELCQVAKLNRAINPIASSFPLDGGMLQGTALLMRDNEQIDLLEQQLAATDFEPGERAELAGIISDMRAALNMQSDPTILEPSVVQGFQDIAQRINALTEAMGSPDYGQNIGLAVKSEADTQPGWGESHIELPTAPETELGYKFHMAAEEMEAIAKDFGAIRNKSPALLAALKAVEDRYKAFKLDEVHPPELMEPREDVVKQIKKIYRRIDNGRIFPASVTDPVEQALIALEERKDEVQGSLYWIDAIAMPGGDVEAGNSACSEQGSGRWLPKPSDTLDTFLRMADPNQGYKGFPLLWYDWLPVSQIVGFLLPDFLADLVPGELPRHNDNGEIDSNFKSTVTNIVTGEFASFSIPVPSGHVWDSIMRVLAGLFMGILFGVPLGLFMGLSRFAKGFFDPLIEL
ncbi:MAG: ABC transporter permease, partial [Gammaproteobacteria bacterium]